MRKTNGQKGITLVALVITIIILLILVGIAIQALTNTGLFKQAQNVKNETQEKAKEEKETLDSYEEQIGIASGVKEYTEVKTIEEAQTDDMLDKRVNSVITDAYGNKITVPAGFKIKSDETTNNAKTVDKGIVVIDSNENEFVWVPVGTIYTSAEHTDANKRIITLGRYDFDLSTGVESAYSGSYIEEDTNDVSTLKNYKNKAISKNITNFKNSVGANGGYYIGRYEARTTTARTAKGDELTQVTEKGVDQLYNFVTQSQAAAQSQNMYNSNKFTSDLINSYSWDTAITFIQKCTDQTNYANQISLNSSLSQTGTTTDKQCNIFDMASNVREWTTETSNVSDNPCVYRGGACDNKNIYPGYRVNYHTSYSNSDISFRPILFINI